MSQRFAPSKVATPCCVPTRTGRRLPYVAFTLPALRRWRAFSDVGVEEHTGSTLCDFQFLSFVPHVLTAILSYNPQFKTCIHLGINIYLVKCFHDARMCGD